jgi:hypothetical protein
VLEVLDRRVWTREEQCLVPTVAPPHEEGGSPVRSAHLEHFAVTVVFAHTVTSDDDAISNTGAHVLLLISLVGR